MLVPSEGNSFITPEMVNTWRNKWSDFWTDRCVYEFYATGNGIVIFHEARNLLAWEGSDYAPRWLPNLDRSCFNEIIARMSETRMVQPDMDLDEIHNAQDLLKKVVCSG